jgi:acyl-CoA synthetase (NDP forming)
MNENNDLSVFFNPKSVAVIGATERPGSWGSIIMSSLLSTSYPGQIYAVNRRAKMVHGVPTIKDVREASGPVDLAVFTIPEQSVEETIRACGEKQVKGIVIITAGFSETSETGREREKELVNIAHSLGILLLGPNVSGVYNLHANFVAAGSRVRSTFSSPLAGISQGGFAFHDLIASGATRRMGVGKFVHTGNECDVTVTDFLDYFGDDPEVKAILMYIETIRDGRRFLEVAGRVAKKKPIVIYKAGRTTGGARAALSHTGALAGKNDIYNGMLHQLGIIISPSMELLLPLGHALFERPDMLGRRIAIFTMGGSWGVVLSDMLEEAGLSVPELSTKLQKHLKSFGTPERASIKNPIDIGAIAGPIPPTETVLAFGREILSSGEVDALVFHGIGGPEIHDEGPQSNFRSYVDFEKELIKAFSELENETNIPVLIGTHYSRWESPSVSDLQEEGIRIYNRIDEITQILSLMQQYGQHSTKRSRSRK